MSEIEGGRIVLVAGTARSGSTVLDLMLGSGPASFSCGEVKAWFRPSKPHHLSPRCQCGSQVCPVWTRLVDLRPAEFHRGVISRLGHQVVVDSSKTLSWLRDCRRWAEQAGLRVDLVLTWKDPLELAWSFARRASGDFAVEPVLDHFKSYYTMAISLGIPVTAVRNADLQADPAGTVAFINTVLELPGRDGQEEFWRTEHHHLFGSEAAIRQLGSRSQAPSAPTPSKFVDRWQRECSRPEIAAVAELLASLTPGSVSSPGPTGSGRFGPGKYVVQRSVESARTISVGLRNPSLVIERRRVRRKRRT